MLGFTLSVHETKRLFHYISKKIEHFYTQPLEESINHFIDRGWLTDQHAKNFSNWPSGC